MIGDTFSGDQAFVGALDKACTAVINHRLPKQQAKAPELVKHFWIFYLFFQILKLENQPKCLLILFHRILHYWNCYKLDIIDYEQLYVYIYALFIVSACQILWYFVEKVSKRHVRKWNWRQTEQFHHCVQVSRRQRCLPEVLFEKFGQAIDTSGMVECYNAVSQKIQTSLGQKNSSN